MSLACQHLKTVDAWFKNCIMQQSREANTAEHLQAEKEEKKNAAIFLKPNLMNSSPQCLNVSQAEMKELCKGGRI